MLILVKLLNYALGSVHGKVCRTKVAPQSKFAAAWPFQIKKGIPN